MDAQKKEVIKTALESVAKQNALKDFKDNNNFKAEQDKTINEWKNQELIKVEIPEFNTAKELLKVSLNGFSNATLLLGEGGIGKSLLTIETIKENLKNDEWEYQSGFTTALSLFKFLQQNKDKKIICLDDVELFHDNKIINILKSALWDINNKRLIYYSSTTDKLDVPSVFELKARLIILCNTIPNEDDKEVSALLSRVIKYEINFSYEQKQNIIMKIIFNRTDISENQKLRARNIIIANTNQATKNFNFRTLEKLISFIKYNEEKAESLFKEILEIDEKISAYYEAQKSKNPINVFKELTGLSRRTYYNIKKKLSAKVHNKSNVA